MSDEERERAFDRLWQGRVGQGASGLGLAIVHRLVTSDGGRVELRPAADHGIDAVVRLPAARPDGRRAPLARQRRAGLAA
jgi:signal transduction histidine kinase